MCATRHHWAQNWGNANGKWWFCVVVGGDIEAPTNRAMWAFAGLRGATWARVKNPETLLLGTNTKTRRKAGFFFARDVKASSAAPRYT